MTDITELAQSLENAASKALIEEGLTWFCEEQLSHEDGIALHKADAEFIALANPANILALVEALEKAQAQSSKWLEAYHKAVSIGARYEERIAELESRTVTVKLSKDYVDDADLFGWGVVVPLEALKDACANAGVTVEIADDGIKVEDE